MSLVLVDKTVGLISQSDTGRAVVRSGCGGGSVLVNDVSGDGQCTTVVSDIDIHCSLFGRCAIALLRIVGDTHCTPSLLLRQDVAVDAGLIKGTGSKIEGDCFFDIIFAAIQRDRVAGGFFSQLGVIGRERRCADRGTRNPGQNLHSGGCCGNSSTGGDLV